MRLLLRPWSFWDPPRSGSWAAVWLLPDMSVTTAGILTAVVVFAIAQSVLAPFLAKIAASNAPAFLGGIGLVSTFVALVIASVFGGLHISGWRTLVLATMVVWLVTALATLLLPLVVLRKKSGGTPT